MPQYLIRPDAIQLLCQVVMTDAHNEFAAAAVHFRPYDYCYCCGCCCCYHHFVYAWRDLFATEDVGVGIADGDAAAAIVVMLRSVANCGVQHHRQLVTTTDIHSLDTKVNFLLLN